MQQHRRAGMAIDEPQQIGFLYAAARHEMGHGEFRKHTGAEPEVDRREGEVEILASSEVRAGAAEKFSPGIVADVVGIAARDLRADTEPGAGGGGGIVERLVRPAVPWRPVD